MPAQSGAAVLHGRYWQAQLIFSTEAFTTLLLQLSSRSPTGLERACAWRVCPRPREDVAGVIGRLQAYKLTYSNTYSCAECSHSHLQELVLSPNPRHYQVRPFIFAVTSILFSHLRRTCVSATAARSFPAVIRNPTRPPRVARQLCCCQTSITVP